MVNSGWYEMARTFTTAGLCCGLLFGAVMALAAPADGEPTQRTGELVLNPDFTAGGPQSLPADWSVWMPVWQPAACRVRRGEKGLLIDAPGKPHAVGGVWQDVNGVRAGQAYAIEAVCRVQNVPSAFRSVYDGSSMIIDPMGRILARNGEREGVVWAEVDLNRRERLWWVGHWRSIGPRHRMPTTYGPIATEPPRR